MKIDAAEAIKRIRAVLSEQPVNQFETPAESQSKLNRVAEIVSKVPKS